MRCTPTTPITCAWWWVKICLFDGSMSWAALLGLSCLCSYTCFKGREWARREFVTNDGRVVITAVCYLRMQPNQSNANLGFDWNNSFCVNMHTQSAHTHTHHLKFNMRAEKLRNLFARGRSHTNIPTTFLHACAQIIMRRRRQKSGCPILGWNSHAYKYCQNIYFHTRRHRLSREQRKMRIQKNHQRIRALKQSFFNPEIVSTVNIVLARRS